MTIVAEGVESEEIWNALKACGCDSAQGHFFSPPLPSDSFREWLESSAWKPDGDTAEVADPTLA